METEWTLDEVRVHGPSAEGPMVLSLLGIVYDVSAGREFFGPGGPYRIYAGHDATFALATMSMRSTDLDVFDYELDADSREALADWLNYFDAKYGRAGRCVDVVHPVAIGSLPRGKDPTAFLSMSHPAVDKDAAADPAAAAACSAAYQAAGSEEALRPAEVAAVPAAPRTRPPRLSQQLLAGTADLRAQLLRAGATAAALQRRLGLREYAAWLAAKGQVYAEIEGQLDVAAEAPVSPALRRADDPRLRRLPAILQDLSVLAPAHTAREWPASPAAARYAGRVAFVADRPHLLLVHLWVRYGTDLAHSELLRPALLRGLGLKAVDGACPGLLYHDFGSVGATAERRARAAALLAAAEAAAAESAESRFPAASEETLAAEMLAEARRAFEMELDLSDEFDPYRPFPKL